MKSLSQGDSSANSSDPDDELGPEYINESGLARILGRVTSKREVMYLSAAGSPNSEIDCCCQKRLHPLRIAGRQDATADTVSVRDLSSA